MRALKYLLFLFISAFLFNSCEKEDDSVIDPTLYFPQILNAFVSPDTNFTPPIVEIIVAVVTSQEPVKSVIATLSDPDNNQIRVYELKDDGVAPDTAAGDGHFTAQINETQNCRIVGFYNIEFVAENVSGLKSNTFIQSFYVKQVNNQIPFISSLSIIPDSIRINTSGEFIFTLRAFDPNGQCDIGRVFYLGSRPDGSSLTPQDLFDDGSCCLIGNPPSYSGDAFAGDSVYTRKFFGAPDQLGYYVYRLRAVDRSGDTSLILSDSIYVFQ